MKRIIYLISIILFTSSCSEKYEYNTEFSMPASLSSPESIALDLASTDAVILEWSGGGAADGSIVQYEVLFTSENGSFENPVHVLSSDLGALPRLTLSHAQLNVIARKAGITAMQTGNIRWTVTGSKAGVVKTATIEREIRIIRGEGIDNIPEMLYLFGSAVTASGETEGRSFRQANEGIFHIYTRLANGTIYLGSSANSNDGFRYYSNLGKLTEGNGSISVSATTGNNPVRIIVDFNALTVSMEEVSNLTATWGHGQYPVTNGIFSYQGEGIFKASGVEIPTFFYGWGWAEERYRFTLRIGGIDYVWGSIYNQNGDSGRPVSGSTPVSWFVINEYLNSASTPWDWMWKMASACEGARFDIYIYTSKNGMIYHEFTNFTPLN